MNRRIKTYGGYFQAFAKTLDKEVLRKIDYLLQLLKSEERLSSRFVKMISDGLFELRISVRGNIYRLFFIFDEGDIVILLNGVYPANWICCGGKAKHILGDTAPISE